LTYDDDDDMLQSMEVKHMKCTCGYEWKPKVKKPNKPKSCPKCKRYLK
jgi:predicted Zn-ribbon and HTH transcriptional regulator